MRFARGELIALGSFHSIAVVCSHPVLVEYGSTDEILSPFLLAIKNRISPMCERSDFVEAGGLIPYSDDDDGAFQTRRILRR